MRVTKDSEDIIVVDNLKNNLGGQWVHDGVSFKVKRGEIVAIIGASGCGKTTLFRSILMLHKATSGLIKVFDKNVLDLDVNEALSIQRRWGVMFQSGALFSSMTLLENVMFPMQQFSHLRLAARKKFAMLKISMAGLPQDAANKYPSELSGGMIKRAALARALAMDAELLFLDEPTAGLDPESAGALDNLVLSLRKNLGLTFVMVTHDLDTLWYVPDRIIFLGEGKVLANTTMENLVKDEQPLIKTYFSGPRSLLRHAGHGGKDEKQV